MKNYVEVTVLNGFPAIACFEWDRDLEMITELEILTRNYKRAEFIERRMKANDWKKLLEHLYEVHRKAVAEMRAANRGKLFVRF